MSLLHLIEVTVLNLASHAFRSFLAVLGVVLGVGAVVGMLAISEGARRESLDRIKAQGIDNIIVHSSKPNKYGGSGEAEESGFAIEYGIKNRDLEHIRKTFENIQSIAPVRRFRHPVYIDGRNSDIVVLGVTPDFLSLTNSQLIDRRGRWLSDLDNLNAKNVCVVGRSAARKLFGHDDPLGKVVYNGGAGFKVVGLMDNAQRLQLAGTIALDNAVYIPIQSGNALFGELMRIQRSRRNIDRYKIDIDHMIIKVQDFSQLENTVARLRTYLRTAHDDIDYRLQVPFELLQQEEATQRIFTIVMGSIAAISLLVGGIGIMNIMLANIYERTREIGTRRALGAKKRDILIQFLLESVVLTGLGGVLGVALGAGIADLVETYAQMTTLISPFAMGISLSVSLFTGIVFGTYPAWKAANLDPIIALKHE